MEIHLRVYFETRLRNARVILHGVRHLQSECSELQEKSVIYSKRFVKPLTTHNFTAFIDISLLSYLLRFQGTPCSHVRGTFTVIKHDK